MSLECEEINGKGHCVLPVINFGTMFYEHWINHLKTAIPTYLKGLIYL